MPHSSKQISFFQSSEFWKPENQIHFFSSVKRLSIESTVALWLIFSPKYIYIYKRQAKPFCFWGFNVNLPLCYVVELLIIIFAFIYIFHLPAVQSSIYPLNERMNASKRIREKCRPDLLLADIVFDVFSEDGSQGSAGGDGEYLFVLFCYIFIYIHIHIYIYV